MSQFKGTSKGSKPKNNTRKGAGSKKTDAYAVFDAFLEGTINEEQYATLTKRASRANTAEVDDVLRETLLTSARRPSVLSCTQGMAINAALTIDSIDEELLFTQIEARIGGTTGDDDAVPVAVELNLFGMPIQQQKQPSVKRSPTRSKQKFITHNFDRSSVYWTRLFQWNMFNDVTQLIIRGIDSLIDDYADHQSVQHNNNNGGGDGSRSVKSTARSNAPKIVTAVPEGPMHYIDTYGLQHRMAQSYHDARSLSCMEFTEMAADILGASLLKLLVLDTRLVFVFRWNNNASFMFFVAFDCVSQGAQPWHSTEYDGSYRVSLHYSDLTADHSLPDDDGYEAGAGGEERQDIFLPSVPRKSKKSVTSRSAKKMKKTPSNHKPQRSIFQSDLFDGDSLEEIEEEEDAKGYGDNSIDDDEEEERVERADYKRKAKAQGQEDATDFIITHYGRRVNRFFIMKLKNTYIAYRTYGYIKNDNTTF